MSEVISESCSYTPTEADLKSMRGMMLSPMWRTVLRFVPILIISLVLAFAAGERWTGIFVGIFLCFLVIATVLIIKSYKQVRASLKATLGTKYKYELTDDRLYLQTKSAGHDRNRYYIDANEPCECRDLGGVYALAYNGKLFSCAKESLESAPGIKRFFESKTEQHDTSAKSNKVRVLGLILIVLAILSLPLALVLWTAFHKTTGFVGWPFFAMLPLPAACLIFGIICEKNGYRAKSRIVIGIVFCVLLVLYGCLGTNAASLQRKTAEHGIEVCEKCGVSIPESWFFTSYYPGVSDSSQTERLHVTIVRVPPEEQDAYYNFFAQKEEHWLNGLPDELKPIVPERYQDVANRRFMLYNADTGEYNSVPASPGKYSFVLFSAADDTRTIELAEYSQNFSGQ